MSKNDIYGEKLIPEFKIGKDILLDTLKSVKESYSTEGFIIELELGCIPYNFRHIMGMIKGSELYRINAFRSSKTQQDEDIEEYVGKIDYAHLETETTADSCEFYKYKMHIFGYLE